MEINKALSIIYSTYNNFPSLPEEMSKIINKSLFKQYLEQNNAIDPKSIELFLDLIYDENEEDRDNIPCEIFNSKYTNLLKLLEEEHNEEEEEPQINVEVDVEAEEIKGDNKGNNNKNNRDTPTKNNQLLNLGSPILIKTSTNKNENDTSIEAVELFNDMKFEEEKYKNNNNINGNINHKNYNSIVRPSNNFNFPNDPTTKLSTQSPREKPNPLFNPIRIPKLSLDFNIQNYKNKKNQNKNMNMKFINANLLYSSNTPHKSSYTIQQKIQDVYFQIHKPKEFLNNINTTPIKKNLLNNYYSNTNQPTKMIKSNNNYNNNINHNFFNNENYLSNIYKSINPLTSSSVKTVSGKLNQLFWKEKRNDLYKNYTKTHNKVILNQKLEGLNKMLNSRSLGLNEEKVLNADDFVTLEDKMNQFTLMKKGSQSKTLLKRDFLNDDIKMTNDVIDNPEHNQP